jgi:hypothetical protein
VVMFMMVLMFVIWMLVVSIVVMMVMMTLDIPLLLMMSLRNVIVFLFQLARVLAFGFFIFILFCLLILQLMMLMSFEVTFALVVMIKKSRTLQPNERRNDLCQNKLNSNTSSFHFGAPLPRPAADLLRVGAHRFLRALDDNAARLAEEIDAAEIAICCLEHDVLLLLVVVNVMRRNDANVGNDWNFCCC